MSLVEPPALVAGPEDLPDHRHVRVRVREVGVVPVHPLAEALRLLRERGGRSVDPRAARVAELVQAIPLDVALVAEPELALHLDLDPEAVTVEAVLVALVEPLHSLVALEDVLICAG